MPEFKAEHTGFVDSVDFLNLGIRAWWKNLNQASFISSCSLEATGSTVCVAWGSTAPILSGDSHMPVWLKKKQTWRQLQTFMASLSSDASKWAGLIIMERTRFSKFPVSSDFRSWIKSFKNRTRERQKKNYYRKLSAVNQLKDKLSSNIPSRKLFYKLQPLELSACWCDSPKARWWRSRRCLSKVFKV